MSFVSPTLLAYLVFDLLEPLHPTWELNPTRPLDESIAVTSILSLLLFQSFPPQTTTLFAGALNFNMDVRPAQGSVARRMEPNGRPRSQRPTPGRSHGILVAMTDSHGMEYPKSTKFSKRDGWVVDKKCLEEAEWLMS